MGIDGHHCTYKKQWTEDKVNDAVAEIIRKLVNNPKFENEIRTRIGNSLDTKDMEKEQEDGRFLKHIKFKFPVFFNGTETEELCRDKKGTVETCVLLTRKNAVDYKAEIKTNI